MLLVDVCCGIRMLCNDGSSLVEDDQQSTVRLLADARHMAYVKGRWVYTDTGCEQLYQIVSPTLPGNGDYSLASMTLRIFICPIAIAYSMGQIIKSFCVCACVCVCVHSHGRISSSIFTKLDTDV